ncbi:protein SPMIP2 isoform X2 [Rhinoraja longicauda]
MSLLQARNNPFQSHRSANPGRAPVVFTGPNATSDYRTKYADYPYYIGESRYISPENTSNLNYLFRPAPCASFQTRKDNNVGAIGWGLCVGDYLNRTTLLSGMQIKRGEFRDLADDKVTHRYQNPWQPPPNVLDRQPLSRAYLAWPLKGRGWHKRTGMGHNRKFDPALDCEPLPPCEKPAAIPVDSDEEHIANNS